MATVKYDEFPDDDGYGSSFGNHVGSYDTVSPMSGGSKSSGLKKSNANNGATDGVNKPRILLMGLRKSGKSSIQKVVFHKMSPNETLFLESTNKLIKNDISSSSFIQFQIWDFPGQIDFFDASFDSEAIFSGTGGIVFVIDSQDSYDEALEKLNRTVKQAIKINPNISFEVFIHKSDSFLSSDKKIDATREIQTQALDDLRADGLDVNLSFYLTSIYDHSIFEAFSKVIQKLIPQLPTLENLLDGLVATCRIEKAFLVDVVSKIYIATDSAAVDMQTYELCSDMIDVVIDVSCIYGMKPETDGLAYDDKSQSIIKLNNGMILYLKEVNKFLALVALISSENFRKHGLIDYNFSCFRDAIHKVFNSPDSSKASSSKKH
mmetsp:Transcript_20781/g.30933  ORF Transcript_20781/g.30933 Transcript_20781/m.30933 type:complete len:377 (-) Transcript_20781:46-1176(-)|eukprot:CAMPEP_0201552170 /NCGR_PEP_ID=MMETSP0173_2-20130828/14535_1 /ASSEMBLY_ACC=CAM_ASM_000268 /TAXON_ID=218659 /ORGANISM="Vexillifera sp., Strain DIVA3 564/2" /LENGTH=376 /DNA_ID=CAMNT_0047962605 /DNA_START=83 /DNA_END=1213 /DNA_ORIENTATION=+